MEAYFSDWVNLLLRFAHVITAIAWIGSSFHFVGLDNSLTPPLDEKDRAKGIGGELWAVHGGGFYHQQKYPVSPAQLPDNLHWSMWQSYSTWLTGFALFTVMYLYNAGTFLIDKTLLDWTPAAAVSTALGFLVVFWVVYDVICRVFAARRHGDLIVGALLLVLIVFASWLSCQLFAGRAAFLLVGAMLATTMSANVFMLIIPGQRKVVASLRAGTTVDPIHGQRGKQRSVHNTYFTLPVVFAMLSNHYGFLYNSAHNWLVLVLMMLAGALIRASFVLRHKALAFGKPTQWGYAVAGVALTALVVAFNAPAKQAESLASGPAGFAEVEAVINQRCVMCHNQVLANKNIQLHTPALITKNAQSIYQQAVVLRQMPMNNASQITEAERSVLGRWFLACAK